MIEASAVFSNGKMAMQGISLLMPLQNLTIVDSLMAFLKVLNLV
jgi:hypothetical protein